MSYLSINIRKIKEELFLLSVFIPLLIGIILILTQVKAPSELFKFNNSKIKVNKKISAKIKEEKKIEPPPLAAPSNLLESLKSPSMSSGNLNSLTAGLVSSSGNGSGSMSVSEGEVTQGNMVNNTGGENRNARVTNVVNPVYPPSAQTKGIFGFVILELTISERGKVEEVTVLDSSPKNIFENAAIDAVRKWSFEPAVKEGQTIKSKLKQKVNFELD